MDIVFFDKLESGEMMPLDKLESGEMSVPITSRILQFGHRSQQDFLLRERALPISRVAVPI